MVTKKRSVKLAMTPADLILAAYFGRKVPAQTLTSAIEQLEIEGEGFEGGDISLLDAAVATVLLKSKRDELPQWMISGRKNVKPVRTLYKPKHLFTLNWAESGPGVSWPTAYYATAVPAFKAIVVTASADSPESFGFTDFAIGDFRVGVDLMVGSRKVITGEWARQVADGQGRWAHLDEEALVSASEAEEWADEVWPGDRSDEDESEDDSDDESSK